jgi:hypothetical protein
MPEKKPKPKSRPIRWVEAASAAVAALTDLKEVQDEYNGWLDNMNDNLRGGATGEKLEEISNLDIEGALDTATSAEQVELPMGFGRD